MLGLMSAMGAFSLRSQTAGSDPTPVTDSQPTVIVHHTSSQPSGPGKTASSDPIALTARRQVRTVTTGGSASGVAATGAATTAGGGSSARVVAAPAPASAPTVSTSGSR